MTLVAGAGCKHEGCDGGWPSTVSWERAFEEAWPTVERHLRDILRARHVPVTDHDDYLQEVAARALAAHVAFHCSADLLPWAATVMRRLHIGAMRRGARLQRIADLARDRHAPDAASAVVAKLDLDRVVETLASWPAFDRDTVLGGRGAGLAAAGPEGGTGAEYSGATYARRHRLRTKLLSAIDGLAGVLGIVRRFHLTHSPQLDQVASAMLTPAAIACVALIVPLAGALHDWGGSGDGASAAPGSIRANVAPASSSSAVATSGAADDVGASVHAHGAGSGDVDAPSTTHRSGPSYRQVHSPVEERVEVDAGERDPYVEVKNTEDETGYYCAWYDGVLARTCVEQPGGAIVSPVPLPL